MKELSEQDKGTLAFLKEMSDQANEDIALANVLTKKGGAFAYYYINVAKLKTLTEEQFALQFPQYISEAEHLRKEYGRAVTADEDHSRINAIEAELKKLPDLIKAALAEAIAANAAPVEIETPAKKGKKPAKVEAVVDTTEDVETEAAEGDEATDETEA